MYNKIYFLKYFTDYLNFKIIILFILLYNFYNYKNILNK